MKTLGNALFGGLCGLILGPSKNKLGAIITGAYIGYLMSKKDSKIIEGKIISARTVK